MSKGPIRRPRLRAIASIVFLGGLGLGACSDPTGPVAPGVPTGVAATLLTPTSARVTWNANPTSDEVVRYVVFRNGTRVGDVTVTQYEDNTLQQLETYRYTVAAEGESGLMSAQSSESPAATITAPDITPPTVVASQPSQGATGVQSGAATSVTFSESIDPATISSTTFTVRVTGSATALPGSVTYTPATRTAQFAPASPMPSGASITATVSTGVRDVAGNALAAAHTLTFTVRDEVAPTVISVTPAAGAANQPVTSVVVVTFSEPMAAASVSSTTFTLRTTSGGTVVPATVSYDGSANRATLTPSANLSFATNYTVGVTNGATDAAGNALASAFSSTFATADAPDTTPPSVTAVSPVNGSTGVSASTSVTVTFSEAMSPASINGSTFTLTPAGGSPVAAAVSYNAGGNSATLAPSAALALGTTYTVSVSSGAVDVAGNGLSPAFTSAFTTVAPADNVAPSVTGVNPANGASGVSVSTAVSVSFSEAMNPATINGSTVTLTPGGGSAIAASVTWNAGSNSASLTPSSALAAGTTYTVSVTSGAQDPAGNGLSPAFSSTFTTAAPSDNVAPTVTGISPAGGSIGVAASTSVTVTFSEPMNPATITSSNISLAPTSGGGAVSAGVSYTPGSTSATLTPSSALANATSYTVTVTTGVRDVAGNALASAVTSSFTTIAAGDGAAPTITATLPANGATRVSPTIIITATFSEPMNTSTINSSTFLLRNTATGTPVNGVVTWNAGTNTAGFNLENPLAIGTNYTATITLGAKDLSGLSLASEVSFSFTTSSLIVNSVTPPNKAANVSTTSPVSVTFSDDVDPSTVNTSTFQITSQADGSVAPGSVSYNAGTRTATFTPSAPYVNHHSFKVNVTTGVKDIAGNSLALPFTSCFTPGSGGGTAVSMTGFWSAEDACRDVHWHVSLEQSGTALTLRPDCSGNEFCRVTALNSTGLGYLGGNFLGVTAATGTVSGTSVTFTITVSNGRTFTFTGSFSATGNGNPWLTGVMTGATLPTIGITFERQGL